ncbi:MAG: hypothetical protein R6V28_03535 [Nitriliruptoraceae bacterium]
MIDQVDPGTDATAGVPWWRRRRDAQAFAKAERWLQRPTANIVDFLSEPGHVTTTATGGDAATCRACHETAERLTRMEAQLGLLLAQRTDPGEAP